jgi:hypothetical protein
MVDTHVSIFFHAHDHLFVKQELDGVVYQECPQPSDAAYTQGWCGPIYVYGDKVNNSGHLRVTVCPEFAKVDYIRGYLPGCGPNGKVAYSYTVAPP